MTLDEIYSKLATHMIKGMMFHEQMANYYDFLGLKGYKRCHEYHFFSESASFRCISRYAINHSNKLIELDRVDDPEAIPSSWFKYNRHDVDANTRMNAVKSGVQNWVEWETDTKELYERMFKECMAINEVATAFKVKEFVLDVDKELKCAERKMIKLSAIDYDMSVIMPEQDELHDKYCNKLKCLGEVIV